jgi:hypothetical protein
VAIAGRREGGGKHFFFTPDPKHPAGNTDKYWGMIFRSQGTKTIKLPLSASSHSIEVAGNV